MDGQTVSGLPVDSAVNPIIDPTKNVLGLFDAGEKRANDLRDADRRFNAAAIEHQNELNTLRAHYHDLLSVAEAKRIDAIRAVDVNAVAVASERATQSASVLANQVVASADALRALVASTAQTMAQAQDRLTQTFNERIASLERSSYEGKGRSQFADPQLERLTAVVEKLAAAQQIQGGEVKGRIGAWQILVGAVALIAAVLAIEAKLDGPPPPATLTVAPK